MHADSPSFNSQVTSDPAADVQIAPDPHDAGLFHLHARLPVDSPRTEVFGFFADALQLEAITPPWIHFRVLTPVPIEMRSGTIIDYRLRIHGLPLRWRSRISVWEPPRRFVDEQLRGPYRSWRHEHRFEDCHGGTLITDHVEYRVRGGALVNRLFVQRDLERIFQFRLQALQQIFGPQGDPRPNR